MASLKSCRSSAILMASIDAPISFTPNCRSVPALARSTARFSAVCPPTVGRMASGRSRSMIAAKHIRRERLDVGPVRELRVGHDCRRVAVDQHHFQTLCAERLARLRSGVVELARLADHNRPGSEDEHRLQVGSSGHDGLGLTSRVSIKRMKVVEQIIGIVRPRRCLRVVLHREHRV